MLSLRLKNTVHRRSLQSRVYPYGRNFASVSERSVAVIKNQEKEANILPWKYSYVPKHEDRYRKVLSKLSVP